ncbi:MAG TPA: D-alanyl-D-alanine carboxypeptidase, partial [Limnobacter sp.]|nr:D-alanyl-D-alanine carboxypeptidase [Limnobacter sp.]
MTAQLPAAQALTPVPPPEIAAKAYVLYDATTDQTLAEFNSHERLEPASLTKLMSAYL